MTAHIVTHFDRTVMAASAARETVSMPQFAEVWEVARHKGTVTVTGQLWEREAERAEIGRINYQALRTNQWERMCDVRNQLGTRTGAINPRGTRLSPFAPWGSGSIKRGVLQYANLTRNTPATYNVDTMDGE